MSSPADLTGAATVPLDAALLRAWPMPVRQGGDKFARGTAVVVGGSPRTPGAVRLAGEAALRMGAGRLQIATASEVAVTLGVAVPEALVVPLEADDAGGLRWSDTTLLTSMLHEAEAVLVGPGMLNEACAEIVAGVLRCISDETLVVLDARALCGLAELADDLIPRGRLVLTPNRQELRTLAGCEESQDTTDDAILASGVAQRFGAVISCFGQVTTPDRVWTMGAGAPGLGTSGSGDVLAGLVVGAAARCGDAAAGDMLGHGGPRRIGRQPRATVRPAELPCS